MCVIVVRVSWICPSVSSYVVHSQVPFDPQRMHQECGDGMTIIFVVGLFSLLADFWVLALPMPLFYGTVYAYAALRVFFWANMLIADWNRVTVVGVLRIFALCRIRWSDITRIEQDNIFYTCQKPNLAIMFVSIPTIQPLFESVRGYDYGAKPSQWA
ncbi:uncharacterized protein BCR38DRAFT_406736 [Pseudomassariella vexata]|uniref:Rhodopsin domain-containing protein n=1 Tax=Pseudomassariella vexata TaxID=1141098 RepID=A0A1Y2EBB9_9PEZI|nr:uncharacterized protein BCR38DRAFT_406736 [Pseudomassariella vexata]ORY68851.1 hypothetical protein BCR38DRAFT_406736 [Pseudomassariella vexata]